MSSRLAHLARRVAADPWFMAYALARFQENHALGDDDLSGMFGTFTALLLPLRLCRRPDPHSATYAADIERISAQAACDSAALRALLEDVPWVG